MLSSCPRTAKFYDLSSIQGYISHFHNEKRNLVAGGLVPGLDPAESMAAMYWDDELAEMAALNVKGCVYKHDGCRATKTFRFAGQNIASYPYQEATPDLIQILAATVDLWFSEYNVTTMADIRKNPSKQELGNREMIGHFTVMVAAPNIRVGCAAVDYSDQNQYWKYLYVVCDYAYTNLVGGMVYKSGPTGSGCKTGPNEYYPNLCSYNEYYNYNAYLE